VNALDAQLAALLRGDAPWPPGADAQALLQRAGRHGVIPLLHDLLGSAPQTGAPQEVLAALRKHALRAAAEELLRRRELERLLGVLSAEGVAPLVLKGTALAYAHYREPHLRPRIDLDLLVPLAAQADACRALERAGYAGSRASGGRFVRTQAEFQRTAGAPGLIVDLHWRISTSPMFNRALSYESLGARATTVTAPRMRVPCAVDLLLHACAHRAARLPAHGAGLDRGDRLIWLQDLRVLAGAMDAAHWAEFLALATEHRLCGITLSALTAAREAVAAVVPGEVDAGLRRGAARREPSAALLHGNRWSVLLGDLRSLDGVRQRLGYVAERILPPPAYVREKYEGMARWPLPALYARHLAEGLRRR
jgi:hypothetical protein